MPVDARMVFVVGRVSYRNPAKGQADDDLVLLAIPEHNQKDMIEIVADAIYRSTYKNIEVIAVNDSSNEGSKEVLVLLARKYHPNLKVIHKENEGKRKPVSTGFCTPKGKYLVLIEYDNVVDEHAITEFMKSFNSDSEIGGVVGYAKVWNANKNTPTKCQDVWYDYAFNIRNTCKSVLEM